MGVFDSDWLIAAIGLTTPVLFAALGELVSQRTGVLNIGLEGMMLVGAFFGFYVAWRTDSLALGMLAAVAAGLVLATVMAALSIHALADQIVVGIGLNIVALGVTTFLNEEIFADIQQVVLDAMPSVAIPVLSSLPGIGRAFDQPSITYAAYLAVPALAYVLYRTRWGLSFRATGEAPEAVETAGVGVAGVRWLGTLFAGAMAGAGGAFLTLASVGVFTDGMTAGRGFIAIAAVIFGRWRPFGVLGACLVFGAADALQLRLQATAGIPPEVWVLVAAIPAAYLVTRLSRRRLRFTGPHVVAAALLVVVAGATLAVATPAWDPPSQLWLSLPYVVALLVLARGVDRARMPSALAIPFRRTPATET